MVCPCVAPGLPGAPEARRDPPCRADPPRRTEERTTPTRHIFDGSDHPDADSLKRRQSRARSTPSAPQEADSGAAPWRLQSLLIRGGGAPDVHVSLVAGGGPRTNPNRGGGRKIRPEQSGECSATVEVTGQSGAAPASVGTKRTAPEQGSLGRLVKKPRVRSKM
jgi:hypothetical protein